MLAHDLDLVLGQQIGPHLDLQAGAQLLRQCRSGARVITGQQLHGGKTQLAQLAQRGRHLGTQLVCGGQQPHQGAIYPHKQERFALRLQRRRLCAGLGGAGIGSLQRREHAPAADFDRPPVHPGAHALPGDGLELLGVFQPAAAPGCFLPHRLGQGVLGIALG